MRALMAAALLLSGCDFFFAADDVRALRVHYETKAPDHDWQESAAFSSDVACDEYREVMNTCLGEIHSKKAWSDAFCNSNPDPIGIQSRCRAER